MSIEERQPPQRGWAATQGSQRSDVTRKVLLAAGALSSLLYVVATDVVAASMWDGYRRTEQMVSELFAVGSPGRDVLLPFTWVYTALFTAFGVGVWNSVRGNRALRIGGGLLTAYGLWNIMGALYPLTLGDEVPFPCISSPPTSSSPSWSQQCVSWLQGSTAGCGCIRSSRSLLPR